MEQIIGFIDEAREDVKDQILNCPHFACCRSCSNRESGFAGAAVAWGSAGLSFSVLAAGAADGASIRRVLFMAV